VRWRALWLVARRELRERARSKAFLASTAFTFLLVAGAIVIGALVSNDEVDTHEIGLVGTISDRVVERVELTTIASGGIAQFSEFDTEHDAEAALEEGEVDAVVVSTEQILVRQASGSTVERILRTALIGSHLVERLEAEGIDPATAEDLVASPGEIAVVALDESEPDDGAEETIAGAAVVLLFVAIMTYGQWVMLGVLEEKANRVVELVVSAVSVRSLLTGKVVGIGLLGLAQMAVLIVAGLTAAIGLDLLELPGGAVDIAAWALVWFVLGFAFYASLNAAAGSLVSRQEDAQTAATPIALLAIAMYFATLLTVLPNPDSTLARVVSLIPPIAPFAFPARIATGETAFWEPVLGAALMVLAITLVLRIAARIYAGALLHTGSRVGVLRAWRDAGELVEAR
jgi:ABC-2 type transport system permease protein